MFKKVISIIVLVFIFTSLAGCSSFRRYNSRRAQSNSDVDSSGYRSVEVASVLRFKDVPVPAGFAIIPEDSYSFQTESFRAGLLKYKGSIDPEVAVNFFKEQMPRYNWELINLIEYEKKLINFQKQHQTCIITIEGGMTRTLITITVAPKDNKAIPMGVSDSNKK